MPELVKNELIKVLARRRLLVTLGIALLMVVLFAWGEDIRSAKNIWRAEREGLDQDNWREQVAGQIHDLESRLDNPFIPQDYKEIMLIRAQQLDFQLTQGINPLAPGLGGFLQRFMEETVSFLLPLLVAILVADLVSGEFGNGTIKLLLTTPVSRGRVLLAKYLAALVLVSAMLLFTGLAALGIGGVWFGTSDWQAPTPVGFQTTPQGLDTAQVRLVPRWQYVLMVWGLGWLVVLLMATVTFALSALMRSTAVVMGLVMAAVAGGNLLGFFLSDWPALKWLFVVHLRLPDVLAGTGSLPSAGLGFSVAVLSLWAVISLAAAFLVFNRQDILN